MAKGRGSQEQFAFVPFGRYLLERRLAIGGMAEIFLAHLPGPAEFKKRVVIKRMLAQHQSNEQMLTMFRDEARLVARFQHPNLIQVYEFTRIDDQLCLVMEYLEGTDLGPLISRAKSKKTPIPEALAAHATMQAAQGLAHAHRLAGEDGKPLNVVHRDVSPNNLLLSWDGDLKVVDFGIAKYSGSEPTQAGYLKGKYNYMAPEHAGGGTVSPQTDVYALGLVFFELLTLAKFYPQGMDPFPFLRHIASIRDNNERLDKAKLSPILREVLRGMLQPKLADRTASMEDVVRALEQYFQATTRPQPSDISSYLDTLFSGKRPTTTTGQGTGSKEIPVEGRLKDPTIELQAADLEHLLAVAEAAGLDTAAIETAVDGKPLRRKTIPLEDVQNADTTVDADGSFLVDTDVEHSVKQSRRKTRPERGRRPSAPDDPDDPDKPRTQTNPARPRAGIQESDWKTPSGQLMSPGEPTKYVPHPRSPIPWVVGISLAVVASVVVFAVGSEDDPPPIRRAETVEVKPSDVPVPTGPPRKGMIRLLTQPPGAVVYLGGAKLGQTPIEALQLDEGRHQIRLVDPTSGLSKTVPVTVEPGKVPKLHLFKVP